MTYWVKSHCSEVHRAACPWKPILRVPRSQGPRQEVAHRIFSRKRFKIGVLILANFCLCSLQATPPVVALGLSRTWLRKAGIGILLWRHVEVSRVPFKFSRAQPEIGRHHSTASQDPLAAHTKRTRLFLFGPLLLPIWLNLKRNCLPLAAHPES